MLQYCMLPLASCVAYLLLALCLQLLWHIVPKTHYTQHFPEEATLIAPRMVQCYIEESYIGKVAEIWASSKSGPYKETIQYEALLKYLVWLCIELDL